MYHYSAYRGLLQTAMYATAVLAHAVVHVILVVRNSMQSNINMQTYEAFQRVYLLEKK